MRVLAFAPLATLACMTASPVRAADDWPVTLEPSSQWVVDFGDEKCVLARKFGDGERAHLISFSQRSPASGFGFVAKGPELEQFDNKHETVFRFGGVLEEQSTWPFKGKSEFYGPSIIYSGLSFQNDQIITDGPQGSKSLQPDERSDLGPVELPQVDLSLAEKIEFISVSQNGQEIIFNTGNLREPMNVLNSCSQDLIRSWGLDLERHRRVTRLPVFENVAQVARRIQQKYPSKALRKGESAIFSMRLIIGEEGEVLECKLENVTVTESLNSTACGEMRRAKFRPALDIEGRPMRSYYVTRITYLVN